MTTTSPELEELLEFLHVCPVGIIEIDNTGAVQRINPHAAGVIAETFGADELVDLSGLLQEVAPDLIPLVTGEPLRRGRLAERIISVPSRLHGVSTVSLTLVRVGGNRVMAVLTDQTQAMRAERLESLGQLAGGIAHDFNNLLSIIGGYATVATEDIRRARALIGERRFRSLENDVGQIAEASERGARLAGRLLAFAHHEPTRAEPVVLDAAIEGRLESLRDTLGPMITLQSSLRAGDARTRLDAPDLEEILLNLAINAREAMPGGGRVTIETLVRAQTTDGARDAGRLPRGACVRLRVTDSGAGMAPAVVESAFDPFFTTKSEGAGAGLGLSIVYGIVQQANGHVELESAPGRGTTVTVLLPLSAEHEPAPAVPTVPAGPSASATPRTLTVLVADDQPAVSELAARLLTRAGYAPLVAVSGREALEIARTRHEPIDLLLTDVMMPEMSGRQLADELRATHPELKVLLMSGLAPPLLGTTDELDPPLLSKPFTAEQLEEKVAAALGRA